MTVYIVILTDNSVGHSQCRAFTSKELAIAFAARSCATGEWDESNQYEVELDS